jgi:hypothetical protein
MDLKHELVELDGAYRSCEASKFPLIEHCQHLEQLVKDYRDFADALSLTVIPRTKRDALQHRAEELLAPV